MIFKRFKRRYMIIVKKKKGSKKKNRVFYYNINKIEIMLDAYWAFEFMDAEKVTIRSTKFRSREILKTFNNIKEWENEWFDMFGEGAQYFVFADRH